MRWKTVGLWVFIIACVVGISSCRGCHRAMADYSGDVDEIWKVQGNAEKRLMDYHWFEESYQQIKAQKISLKMLHQKGEDIVNEIMIVNNWIGEYNARSRQYDREMWKRNDLPREIDLIEGPENL